jgi:RHS repeat-associated protein
MMTDINASIKQHDLYNPFGEVITEYKAYWHQGKVPDYMFNAKELDEENGMYYYSARYYNPPTFISRDPLFEKYPFMSPYTYCSNNPINRIDPTGMSDGWIQDENGNVFWDNNTNSQEEFEQNYGNNSGYSYVSDANNPNSYTLPSGEGQLVMNRWNASENINGVGGLLIDISFVSTNNSAEVGWTQTYSSNLPGINDGNLYTALPQTNIPSERLDCAGLSGSPDASLCGYYNPKPSANLWDAPMRAKNSGSQYDISFNAQSTVLVNGKRTASIGWGFTVTSRNSQTINAPTILKSTTNFHDKAVKSLSNRILGH